MPDCLGELMLYCGNDSGDDHFQLTWVIIVLQLIFLGEDEGKPAAWFKLKTIFGHALDQFMTEL